jgi:DNA-binding PadR family transcriptional regulator
VSETPQPDDLLPLPHLPLHILLALSAEESMHGWAIIKRVEEMTDGRTCPSTGSLYLAMGRLTERGLLEEIAPPAADTDARRKYYRVTPFGRRVIEAESRRLAGLVEMARASDLLGSGR